MACVLLQKNSLNDTLNRYIWLAGSIKILAEDN
jgi:hypothetical protein